MWSHPIGLLTSILKPQIWHYDNCHLGFLEPEGVIFEQEGAAGEDIMTGRILYSLPYSKCGPSFSE